MKWRFIKFFSLTALIIVLLGMNTLPAWAISAEIVIQSTQIATGDRVQFDIVIHDVLSAGQPEIKPIDGLEIAYIGGPMMQAQIINGVSSSSITYSYIITALKPGNYTIGPYEITAGLKRINTNTIKLVVVKSSSPSQNTTGGEPAISGRSGSDLFFDYSIPKTKIYMGEKIPITFRVYIGVRLGGSINPPVFNQPEIVLDQLQKTGQYQKIINGMEYVVVEISGVLTPVKTGTFTLGPAKMELPVIIRNRRSFFDDFFSDSESRMVTLTSNTKTITVLPLPLTGKPQNFSQGIGHFQISATTESNQVKQGDPITVQLTVTGNGNLQSLTAPYLANTNGLKVYDPQRKESAKNGAPDNRVTFEQVLIPLDTSIKKIGPFVLSYFDPDTGSYRQAVAAALPITVKPNPDFSAATVLTSSNSTTGDEELGQDLIYIKDKSGGLRSGHRPVYQELWFILLQLLPLIGLVIAYGYRSHRKMLEADTPESRALRANNQADRRLATAGALKASGRYNELLEELHLTLRQYLGEKFNLPAAGMTVKVVETLDSMGIASEITKDIRKFFEHYDYHRFTGAHLNQTGAEELWELVVSIITALDNRKKPKIGRKLKNTAVRGGNNGK